jgi:hypothetical protein
VVVGEDALAADDQLTVMLTEYRSVRTESLEALGQIHTIVQYGLAALGVSVGGGLAMIQKSVTVAAVVLMIFCPAVIVFGVEMMAVAVFRVIQSRQYLRRLEPEIAARVGSDARSPRWERIRGTRNPTAVNGYPFAIIAAVCAAAVLGPGLGGYELARQGYWFAFAIGVLGDGAAITYFGYRCLRTYRRLDHFNDASLLEPDPVADPGYAEATGTTAVTPPGTRGAAR